ncbi:hypothetical protein F5Y06DRAFT_189773 [Hypoxylon sp. FL0890]|nr:hypothetical protein F5Y06DRAFT_189773 [Hypoxylon sp. FL0890]
MRRIAQSSSLRGSRELPLQRVPIVNHYRPASSQSNSKQPDPNQRQDSQTHNDTSTAKANAKKKTMAELDAELQQKMSGLSGDGGESGVEYEDGKPVAMKRSVKNNMFRYI